MTGLPLINFELGYTTAYPVAGPKNEACAVKSCGDKLTILPN
jgi:hypothetical protein